MRTPSSFSGGLRTSQRASKPFQSGTRCPRQSLAQQHSRHQYTGTALFSTGTADSVTTTSNTQANSSRDERSTARQTAEEANSILVDGVVVQPAYRSTPWEAEAKHAATATDKALIMFVSESGICRGPLAAAAFAQLLQHSPLRDCLQVTMRATRDYCQGQPADPAAATAADTLGFSVNSTAAAAAATAVTDAAGSGSSGSPGVRVFNPLEDIVAADMVLVMDKYTAADVLREVSSYDLINPGGRYSSRVRLLGSFHPQLASQTKTPDGQDIDDALYGNEGGDEEQAAVLSAAKVIVESCRNLLQYSEDLAIANGLPLANSSNGASSSGDGGGAPGVDSTPAAAESGNGNGNNSSSSSSSGSEESVAARFKAVLAKHVQDEGVIEWLVPPMLQGGNLDVDGWV